MSTMTTTSLNDTFTLSGMTCMGCVGRVQKALAPFADHVDVALSPQQAVFTGRRGTLADLQTALQETNY